MTVIIGIDPGLSGAVACLAEDFFEVSDMPTFDLVRNRKKKRDLDLATLVLTLSAMKGEEPVHAFVEQVHSMPKQGVSSSFAFGKCYGAILGVLAALGIPQTPVHSRVWKKAVGVPAAKDGARARASQLMPTQAYNWTRVKDDGRAEAALLALYGWRESRTW